MFDLEDILFRKEIKQIELARELGITKQAVNLWHTSGVKPRLETQIRILNAIKKIIERRQNAQ